MKATPTNERARLTRGALGRQRRVAVTGGTAAPERHRTGGTEPAPNQCHGIGTEQISPHCDRTSATAPAQNRYNGTATEPVPLPRHRTGIIAPRPNQYHRTAT